MIYYMSTVCSHLHNIAYLKVKNTVIYDEWLTFHIPIIKYKNKKEGKSSFFSSRKREHL